MRNFLLLTALLLGLCAGLGCSSENEADLFGTPNDPKDTIPAVILFSRDVKPIMEQKCATNANCHRGNSRLPLITFGDVQPYATDILTRVQLPTTNSAYMPLGAPKLSPNKIEIIKRWVSQGTQNN
jgi:hypothetical protein